MADIRDCDYLYHSNPAPINRDHWRSHGQRQTDLSRNPPKTGVNVEDLVKCLNGQGNLIGVDASQDLYWQAGFQTRRASVHTIASWPQWSQLADLGMQHTDPKVRAFFGGVA